MKSRAGKTKKLVKRVQELKKQIPKPKAKVERKKRAPSKWVLFLKEKALETGESYSCLASKPEVKEEYRRLNPEKRKVAIKSVLPFFGDIPQSELQALQEAESVSVPRLPPSLLAKRKTKPVVDNTQLEEELGVQPKEVIDTATEVIDEPVVSL